VPASQRILYTANYYEDNRYNMALVLRNSKYPSNYLLETSLVHVFFEKVPIPRAEDWHRSYYLVFLTIWARLVGSNDETLLRLPHLAAVVTWMLLAFALCMAILKTLLGPETSQRLAKSPLFIVGVACTVLSSMMLSPWIRSSLTGAFLDDVPSVCPILIGLLVLLGGHPINLRRVSIFGFLCGVAAGIKDINLLWLPISTLTVITITFLDATTSVSPQTRIRASLILGLTCGCASVLGYAPKILWTLYDFGVPVKNLSQYIHITTFYNTWPKTRHYPYFIVTAQA
jgi:hypothetical protein